LFLQQGLSITHLNLNSQSSCFNLPSAGVRDVYYTPSSKCFFLLLRSPSLSKLEVRIQKGWGKSQEQFVLPLSYLPDLFLELVFLFLCNKIVAFE
jgi:hypothetical protein